jgi:hypothetical protein
MTWIYINMHFYLEQKTPIYRLLILGGLIILSNFLAYCGSRGNLVPGPVVVLLQQASTIRSKR